MKPARPKTDIPSLVALLALTAATPLLGQSEPPKFTAIRASSAPVIDGDLSDGIWAQAEQIQGFTQREPDEGKPATEKTVVRVVYDDAAIYISAKMDDSGPVTTRLGRRDNDISSDWFRLYLDPHHDHRTGFGFWVNPSNVKVDMVLYNDGWTDWDWDGVWDSATRIDGEGWTAEIRIPYSQLRFPDRAEHVWGINFGRVIERKNEDARLIYIPRTETGFVSRFAELHGISNIEPPRSFEVTPYVVGRAGLLNTVAGTDPFNSTTDTDATAGVDFKYGLTSNLTLTGSINPDFGQVEVDPAQVNLSQFELFFPEKRPFFIEGSNLFNFGQGGSDHNFGFSFSTPQYFYSRRIGRSPQAVFSHEHDFNDAPGESTILGALKLTGKFGDGWSIGVLDAYTQKETANFSLEGSRFSGIVEPATNYFVMRPAKEYDGGMSRIGGLFTAVNRDVPSELGWMKTAAYTGGIDGYTFFGKKDWIWEWSVGGSRVEGSTEAISLVQNSSARYYDRPDADHIELDPNRTALEGWTASQMLAKQTGNWKVNLKAHAYSPGFDTNDLGFLTRTDLISSHAVVLYNNPEPGKLTRDRNWWIGKYQSWNFDGDLLKNGFYGRYQTRFHNYWYTGIGGGYDWAVDDDRATRGGPVVTDPTGMSVNVYLGGDHRKPFNWEIWGETWRGGEGTEGFAGGTWFRFKPATNIQLTVNPNYSDQHSWLQYVTVVSDTLATSTFGKRYVFAEIDRKTLELETRIDWTFSPTLSLQMFLQPFIASGDYVDFKELERPRSLDYMVYGVEGGTIDFNPDTGRYTIDPDGGGAASPFSFSNPDFNFRSLRGSAILRWEFRPGSAVYFVWNENRANGINDGRFRPGRDFDGLIDAPSDDVFLIKFSYWLAL